MAILKTELCNLRTAHDVMLSRQVVRRLTQEIEFSLVDQTKMITAASELARNTLIYGNGGTMQCDVMLEGNRKGLRLIFLDDGPGIPDVAKAMQDGWTSGTGLGKGLPGAKRLVNEFELESTYGKGTRVTITRWR